MDGWLATPWDMSPAVRRKSAINSPSQARSKQPQLVALRRFEQVSAQRDLQSRQIMLSAGDVEPGSDQFRPGALAAHAGEEIRIIVAPAADRLDRRHHLGGSVGIMLVEPGPEQRRHLVRQPDRMKVAPRAPASAAASTSASSSWSVIWGITGAIEAKVGTPASLSALIAADRLRGQAPAARESGAPWDQATSPKWRPPQFPALPPER